LEHELRQLEMETRQLTEMEPLLPFAEDLLGLEEARRRMAAVNAEETAALLTRLSKQIDGLRKTLEAALKPEAGAGAKPPVAGVKKTVANRAVLTVSNMRETLKAWFGFYNGYDPIFSWWVGEPYKQLDRTLQDYGVFLREKLVGIKADDATAIIGDPIGRDALL